MAPRCESYNCNMNGVCGIAAATPRHFGLWVYILVALGIIGGMRLVQSDSSLSDLVKEWLALSPVSTSCIGNSEMPSVRSVRSTGESRYGLDFSSLPAADYLQNAFHQNLTQMRETARAFILSLPQGKGEYSRDFGDEQHQGPKSSGLRHYVGDDSDADDGLVMNQGPKGGRF